MFSGPCSLVRPDVGFDPLAVYFYTFTRLPFFVQVSLYFRFTLCTLRSVRRFKHPYKPNAVSVLRVFLPRQNIIVIIYKLARFCVTWTNFSCQFFIKISRQFEYLTIIFVSIFYLRLIFTRAWSINIDILHYKNKCIYVYTNNLEITTCEINYRVNSGILEI